MNAKEAAVGILVGRFQIDKLHQAHIDLIQSVCNLHPKVIIFLGLSPVLGTKKNPLDFEARKQMILECFPDINVLYIPDIPGDNEAWSKKLDEQISHLCPVQKVILYGGRDSFVSKYCGRYPIKELESKIIVSASEIRDRISKSVKKSQDFRTGVIWSAFNRYPTCFPTVDIALFKYNEKDTEILLCRKPHEKLYRFIGGFAEPNSDSFEDDAKRELYEEAGGPNGHSISASNFKYICSKKIDDLRYRDEVDQIKTLFFMATLDWGRAEPGDPEIAEVRWFRTTELREEHIVDTHKPLFQELVKRKLIPIVCRAEQPAVHLGEG